MRLLLTIAALVCAAPAASAVERVPGQTVYRGAYGLVVTVTDEACPGAAEQDAAEPDAAEPARRVTVARPEGTSGGCTLPSE